MVQFDGLMPRSWIGFGRSIVRGSSVSSQRILITVLSCPCPPLPYPSPSIPSSRPHSPVLHRDISVDVLSRDVPTLALTCTDIRC